MQKTQGEIILSKFLKKYNEELAKVGKEYTYTYDSYVQKIPLVTKTDGKGKEVKEEVSCTVLEIIRNTKMVDDTIEKTIVYEDYKPNSINKYTSMKEKLIQSFIVKGMITVIETLEAINKEKDENESSNSK